MANHRQRRRRQAVFSSRKASHGWRRGDRSRRHAKPSFRDVLGGANSRAWRRTQPAIQKAIADTHVGDLADDFMVQHLWLRRFLAIFCLLPISIITTYAFFGQLSSARADFWLEREFWHFALGFVLWLGVFLTQIVRKIWLYLYVLGHELTHAIFIVCSFGRLGEFHVTSEGGYVETTKTSLLIALSPYFVPFWSVLGLSVYALLAWFLQWPPMPRGMLIFLGFSWGFHLVWTLWMIPKDQPDLRENGVLFSVLFVYLVNMAVIVGLLVLASAIEPHDFVAHWRAALDQGLGAATSLLRWGLRLIS